MMDDGARHKRLPDEREGASLDFLKLLDELKNLAVWRALRSGAEWRDCGRSGNSHRQVDPVPDTDRPARLSKSAQGGKRRARPRR
jgi:hypothetical protein